MVVDTRLDAEARAQLEADDPETLAEYDRQRSAELDKLYPQVSLADIDTVRADLEERWSGFNTVADAVDKLRYLRDETPEKWARYLEQGDRVFTRLSHNETNRVVAMVTRNPYKVHLPPGGATQKAEDRAEKRRRWNQEFLPACERRAGWPLRRTVVDGATSSGLAAWEVYLTDAYDNLDLERHDIPETDEDGNAVTRVESDHEYMTRTEAELLAADMPICVREVHRSALLLDRHEDGLYRAAIVERKPYRIVYNRLRTKLSNERFKDLELPDPGDPGWPSRRLGTSLSQSRDVPVGGMNGEEGDVETIRYYDRRWYAYVVDGKIVDGPVEHGLPGVPIFPLYGIVTSSPDHSEQIEGVTWGMASLERITNDLLTLGADTAYTYSRPRPVAVATDPKAHPLMDPRNPKVPQKIDLSDPSKVPQLSPGYTIIDAFQGFQPKVPMDFLTFLQELWQRNGRNPVASGASPGSDAAGYTVNSLIGAADDLYGIILDNDARTWGEVLDFVNQTIKYTIGERVYLPVKGTGKRRHTVEWLGLAPEDIDDVPNVVTIDPTTEQNRMARIQTLTDGWKNGVVPRRYLQEEGYGAEDAELWDEQIIEEMAMERLNGFLVDNVMQRLMAAASPQAAMAAQGAAPGVPPPAPGGAPAPGGPPPGGEPPPGPSVGAELNAASQTGPGAGSAGGTSWTQAMAGTNAGGYSPPAGASASGPRGGG